MAPLLDPGQDAWPRIFNSSPFAGASPFLVCCTTYIVTMSLSTPSPAVSPAFRRLAQHPRRER